MSTDRLTNVSDLKSIFVFDYYDFPLFFISKNTSTKKYYFFYFIDTEVYFFKELTRLDISLIFNGISIRNILQHFYDDGSLKIINFKSANNKVIEIRDFLINHDEAIEELFPEDNEFIEYDEINNLSFEELRLSFENYFPELFNVKDITLRLIDKENSNQLSADSVLTSIEYVKNIFNGIKSMLQDKNKFTDTNLDIAAFSRGSFKIDFTLSEEDQGNIFGNEVYFDEMISFMNFLDNPHKNEIGFDTSELIYKKEFILATNDYYKFLEEENLVAEFYNKDVEIGVLKESSNLSKNLSEMARIIREEEKVIIREEEYLNIKGEVLSANKSRNHFKIASDKYGDVSGIFEKELFKDIKASVKQITVSKRISARVNKIVENNSTNTINKVTYILMDFDIANRS